MVPARKRGCAALGHPVLQPGRSLRASPVTRAGCFKLLEKVSRVVLINPYHKIGVIFMELETIKLTWLLAGEFDLPRQLPDVPCRHSC